MAKKHKNRKDGFVYSTDPEYLPEENPFAALGLAGDQSDEEHVDIDNSNQVLRIYLDRKSRGGKEVTIVKGFQGDDKELKDLGKYLKSSCGVGGTVKDGLILIQGNHRKKVADLLKKKGFSNTKLSGG